MKMQVNQVIMYFKVYSKAFVTKLLILYILFVESIVLNKIIHICVQITGKYCVK